MPKAVSPNTTAPSEMLSPDAAILQGCAAIMKVHNRPLDRKRGGYKGLCLFIEEQAQVIAPIAAKSEAGVKVRAAVVQALARNGMAGYAERLLAGPLAADVLAGGAA